MASKVGFVQCAECKLNQGNCQGSSKDVFPKRRTAFLWEWFHDGNDVVPAEDFANYKLARRVFQTNGAARILLDRRTPWRIKHILETPGAARFWERRTCIFLSSNISLRAFPLLRRYDRQTFRVSCACRFALTVRFRLEESFKDGRDDTREYVRRREPSAEDSADGDAASRRTAYASRVNRAMRRSLRRTPQSARGE